MKKLIAIVMMTIISAITVLAETPKEAVAKHPHGLFYFCKKKPAKLGDMNPIERFVFVGKEGKIYIKFYDVDEEQILICERTSRIGKVKVFHTPGITIYEDNDKDKLYYYIGDDMAGEFDLDWDRITEVQQLIDLH